MPGRADFTEIQKWFSPWFWDKHQGHCFVRDSLLFHTLKRPRDGIEGGEVTGLSKYLSAESNPESIWGVSHPACGLSHTCLYWYHTSASLKHWYLQQSSTLRGDILIQETFQVEFLNISPYEIQTLYRYRLEQRIFVGGKHGDCGIKRKL